MRLVRAMRLLARDERIPRWLRWLTAVGLMPIPGPFDEALLVMAAVPLALFHRRSFVDAWRASARSPSAGTR